MSGESFMNDDGESYCGIVPTKQPNLGRTPSRESRPSGLKRVRETARKDGKLKFIALLHHVSIDLLRESYFSLKKQAAPGWMG